MLVLTRKQGESLQIGDEISVTVVRVNGNRVTVGVEAPTAVSILRGELCLNREIESGDFEEFNSV